MKNYTFKRYETGDSVAWNVFITAAKNTAFLFHRDFMDYHNDRFSDFSIMVFDDDKLAAVLPANHSGNEIFSHQGLTYGGLVYDESLKLSEVISVFKQLLYFLHQNRFATLRLKSLPSVYHKKPSQELDYALFLADAKLFRRDALAVIDLSKDYKLSDIRKRGVKKGKTNNLVIKEESHFEDFWNTILIPNLEARHHTKPVHSIAEITLLKTKFPNSIRQFNVYLNHRIIAGTTIFETDTVAHAQYIAADENRNETGSIDYLFDYLLREVFADKAYFDFGISNEEQGRKLNTGLSYWKESFGASAITQDFYEVETTNYIKLENVYI